MNASVMVGLSHFDYSKSGVPNLSLTLLGYHSYQVFWATNYKPL